MKFILSLAWKNLSRYRRRTIITVTAIAIGLGLFIMIDAMLSGADKETERNVVNYETGSVKIFHPEYWEESKYLPLKYNIKNPDRIIQALGQAGYKQVTKRILFSGELFFDLGSTRIQIYGLDVDTDNKVFALRDTVITENIEGKDIKTAGEYLKKGENCIMVGEWLADDLGISVGDEVTIRTRTVNDVHETIDLYVIGIINCPNPLLNQGAGMIPLDVAQKRLQMEDMVTEIDLHFAEWLDLNKETQKLKDTLKNINTQNLEAMTWLEMASDFLAMAKAKKSGTGLFLFIVILIALIGVSNTMLMAVFERVKEIGMMRAMGMQDSAIRWAFLFEAGGIGFIGGLFGVILGALLNIYMVYWGIDFSMFIRDMGNIGYRITDIFRSTWNFNTMITAFFVSIFVTAIISLIPSTRALKMQITDCLRDK